MMVTFLLWAGWREILVFYFDRGPVALHPAEEGAPCSGAEPRGPGRDVRLDRESGCGGRVSCRLSHARGHPINPTLQCCSPSGPCISCVWGFDVCDCAAARTNTATCDSALCCQSAEVSSRARGSEGKDQQETGQNHTRPVLNTAISLNWWK